MKRSLSLFGFACFGLLLAGALADVGLAQQPEAGRQRGGFGGGRGFGGINESALLGNEKVQKELELIDDQVKQITKLREDSQAQARGQFEGIRDLPEAERRAKFEEMQTKREAAQKELRGKINEVLLPNQRDRLKELMIQAQGAGALSNAETADALKLSDDQKKQLATVREEAATKMREAMGAGRGEGQGPSEEARAKFQEMRKEMNDKLLAVLSTEQRAQFEKLKGEKADIDFTQLRGPGGRGGARPGAAPNN
ncbi:MAG: hypothetical protein K8U03_13895 [Planctomycetia bacterium]|nr:hypothetical protein [Planctomycetia bacterium]